MRKRINRLWILGLTVSALVVGGCGGNAVNSQISVQSDSQEQQEENENTKEDTSESEDTTESEDVTEKEDTSESEDVTEKVEAVDAGNTDETQENLTQEDTAQESETDAVLQVTFLDVGQGNSVLAECDGYYALIDGGDSDKSSFVVSYLQQQDIESFAYLISSHYDSDHLNGLVGALNVFSCDTVLDADYETDTRVYESYKKIIAEKGIEEIHPALGDTYSLGAVEITVVSPVSYGHTDENDDSVGIKLELGDSSFLICGDAGEASEEEMLASGESLDADVYLASHHGSSYSSSSAFLTAVSPEYVVISAGMGNSYGHPTADALARIQSTGAALYRTDLQGTITVSTDGTNYEWSCEPSADYRSGDEVAGNTSDAAESTDTGSTDGGAGSSDAAVAETESVGDATDTANQTESTYVLNTNTKKFHNPDCSSVSRMNEENKEYSNESRDTLIQEGYEPCKNCNP